MSATGEATSPPRLRADARRNADQIRRAAIDAFQDNGLSVPLEEVAKAAGVSKATIFNRFGGRIGLIDAVIEEVVATELHPIIDRARAVDDVGERLVGYVADIRDLQYRRSAFVDVMLQTYPDSPGLVELCRVGGDFNDELVAAARAAGVLREDFTADDLHALLRDNALSLKHGGRPSREDYDRRTAFVVEGIRS